MAHKIEFKQSGKAVGIKGLYKDASSGRLYVRLSINGVDRQKTLEGEFNTFSSLQRASERAINSLRREMECSESHPKQEDSIDAAMRHLAQKIKHRWGLRNVTSKRIKEYLRCTRGLCLCTKKSHAQAINAHNIKTAQNNIYGKRLSSGQRAAIYQGINIVFRQLILSQEHLGCNPCDSIAKPRHAQERRNNEMGYTEAAMVIHKIRSAKKCWRTLELEMYFRLCFETGQRPIDIYMIDVRSIENKHYSFMSHKTARHQRVSHLISDEIMDIIDELIDLRKRAVFKHSWQNEFSFDEEFECFWSLQYGTYARYLNTIIHGLFGERMSLYSTRHFFISEVFHLTENEFWAEAFTHEGRTANTRHYLHPDQKRADEIIMEIHAKLRAEIENLS